MWKDLNGGGQIPWQARTQRGRVHWVHVHPPHHLGKKFLSEMSKRGEKVPPNHVGKNNAHVPFRYDRIKTKKAGKKEEKRKKRGIKLKK